MILSPPEGYAEVFCNSRITSYNVCYTKLLRLPVISDIIGIRIICPFLQDLNEVERCLHDAFNVYEVERKKILQKLIDGTAMLLQTRFSRTRIHCMISVFGWKLLVTKTRLLTFIVSVPVKGGRNPRNNFV